MTDRKLLVIILSFFFAVYIAITIMTPWSALLPFRKDFFEVFPEYNVDIEEIDRIECVSVTNAWGERFVSSYSGEEIKPIYEKISSVKLQRNWLRSIQCLFMGDDYLENGNIRVTLFLKDGQELKIYIDCEHGDRIQRINDSCFYCSSGYRVLDWQVFPSKNT